MEITFKNTPKKKRDFIVKSNLIIAQFIGIEKYESAYSTFMRVKKKDLSEYVFNIGFQKSWDALMPVIDKIENFENHMVKIDRHNYPKIKFMCTIIYSDDLSKTIHQESKDSKIDACYMAVVKYVEAYNKLKKRK